MPDHPPPPPPDQPDPPHQDSLWRRFRRQNRVVQIGAWVIVGIVVITIIGAVSGGGSGTGTTAATTAAPAATTAPVADETTPAPAEPVDTGRMSDGEWRAARDTVFDVNGEMKDYTDQVGSRCAVLLQAAEVAEGLECIDDAYDGVEGSVAAAVSYFGDARGDVAKRCRTAVDRVRRVADEELFPALRVSKVSLDSLDAGVVTLALNNLRKERARWGDATGDMLQLCAPA